MRKAARGRRITLERARALLAPALDDLERGFKALERLAAEFEKGCDKTLADPDHPDAMWPLTAGMCEFPGTPGSEPHTPLAQLYTTVVNRLLDSDQERLLEAGHAALTETAESLAEKWREEPREAARRKERRVSRASAVQS
jgi:hypothetical protein